MKKAHLIVRWFLLISTILFGATGCGLQALSSQELSSEDKLQTQVAETMIAMNAVETLAAQGQMSMLAEASNTANLPLAATPTATLTPSPTFTLSPTITLSSTLEVTMASVSHSTNCRTGPDTVFDNIGALLVGEQAEVVGQTTNGMYWIIKNPDRSGECWLWGYYATVTGPTEGLPFYDPPPTPTPAFVWAGTWSVMIGPAEGGMYTSYTMNVVTAGREFTGSLNRGGVMIPYIGTISNDYLSASGTWQEEVDETGPFKFYAVGVNQFQGNISDGGPFGFCGARSGTGFPPPSCYRP